MLLMPLPLVSNFGRKMRKTYRLLWTAECPEPRNLLNNLHVYGGLQLVQQGSLAVQVQTPSKH